MNFQVAITSSQNLILHFLLYVGALDNTEIQIRPTDETGMEDAVSVGDSKYHLGRNFCPDF